MKYGVLEGRPTDETGCGSWEISASQTQGLAADQSAGSRSLCSAFCDFKFGCPPAMAAGGGAEANNDSVAGLTQEKTDSTMGAGGSSQWKEITDESHAADPHHGTTAAASVELADRDDAAAERGAAAGTTTTTYKVYKRRWFGLVQLTLLNIIVSWDVRIHPLPFPTPHLPYRDGIGGLGVAPGFLKRGGQD